MGYQAGAREFYMPGDNASDIFKNHGLSFSNGEVSPVEEAMSSEVEETDEDEALDLELDYDNEDEDEEDLEDDQEIDDAEDEDDVPTIPELGDGNYTDQDRKAWEQRWKGVLKRESRIKANEEDLSFYQGHKDQLVDLINFERALTDPDHYKQALKVLAKAVSERHGNVDIAEILDLSPATPKVNDDYEDDDYEFDRPLLLKAKEEALKEFEKKYGSRLAALDEFEKTNLQTKQEKQLNEYLDRTYKGLSAKIETETGFKPTKAQVKSAIQENPEIKDPAKAVKVHFLDEIQKAQKAAKRIQKAPAVPKSVQKGSDQVNDGSPASIFKKHGIKF